MEKKRLCSVFFIGLFLLFQIISIKSVKAQESGIEEEILREEAINVFIDGQRMDMNYVREQIPYVNFVRDTNDADVYIRESRQSNGSGGTTYTYTLEGQAEYLNMNDTLILAISPDETNNEAREKRTNMVKMGLMRYVAKTPLYEDVIISAAEGSQRPEVEAVDRWNNWVFEIQTRPQYNSEDSKKTYSIRNSVQISKITPDIKIETDFRHNHSTEIFTFKRPDELGNLVSEKDTFITNSFSFDNLIVFSISDHWSVGSRFDFTRSTFSNYDSKFEITPSIEYDIYPYSESTHRQLRIMYGLGVSLNNYTDTTIYFKTQENLVQQQLQVAYRVEEKWGYVNVSLEGSNYLHDFGKNRLDAGVTFSFRVTKGLSVNIRSSYARIRDQITLPKGEATVEDVYLNLRELATLSDFSSSISLTYTFGSIYNNVVNPRFGNFSTSM